jgi:hypothetical protein
LANAASASGARRSHARPSAKRERVVVDALRTDERCDLLVSLARIERRAAGELRPTGEQRCIAGTPVRWVLQVCVDRRLGLL